MVGFFDTIIYMTEARETPIVESTLPTEKDVKNFYTDLLRFIKDNVVQITPGKGSSGKLLNAQGFLFRHGTSLDDSSDKPITDSYQSSNIRTEIVRIETILNDENVEEEVERISRPRLLISTQYSCSQKDTHAPSDIPPNTPVQISISGLREHFIIDGKLEGSGLSSSGKPDEIAPMKTEDFSKYRSYFDKASLQPPHPPIFFPG